MSCRILSALLLCLFLTLPARASLVTYEWSPAEIFLASDSLTTFLHPSGKISGGMGCKMYQQGEFFFVFSGALREAGGGRSLPSLAREAAKSAAGIGGIVAAFEKLAKPQIGRIMNPGWVEKAGEALGQIGVAERIDVVFVHPKSHALAHLGYTRQRDGSARQDIRTLRASVMDRPRIVAIGIKEEAMKTVQPSAGFMGVPFIAAFFGAQVKHEEARLARREIPLVLGDVSILRIANGEAAWVDGYRGACPAVR